MTLLSLFWAFVQVGALSIGGGYAAMPLIQEQVVTLHGWLDMTGFGDIVAIAEMTPGPIAINAATFVGTRIAGVPGALTATLGCILPACIMVSLLSLLYRRYRALPLMQGILGALRPVVVALIAGAALSLLKTALFTSADILEPLQLVLFAAALVLLRKKRCGPIAAMLLCGGVYLLLYLPAML